MHIEQNLLVLLHVILSLRTRIEAGVDVCGSVLEMMMMMMMLMLMMMMLMMMMMMMRVRRLEMTLVVGDEVFRCNSLTDNTNTCSFSTCDDMGLNCPQMSG